jgi:hypothetical protein
MAGFQLTLYGRIWVTPEAPRKRTLSLTTAKIAEAREATFYLQEA